MHCKEFTKHAPQQKIGVVITNEFFFCAGENPEKNTRVAFQTIKGDEKPLEGLSQIQSN